MKILRNKITFLLLAVFVLSTGCGFGGGGGAAPVTLNMWGTFESSDKMAQFIADYQSQHNNVQILYTEKNVDTYEEDLVNALAAGTGPDIFTIHNDWLPKYKDKMVEAPDKTYNIRGYQEDFVDIAAKDLTSDGKIFAVPLNTDTLALYYNKDILGSLGIAVPPRTWADLQADVKKVIQANKAGLFNKWGIALGTTNNINRAVDIVYLLMLQNGAVPYTSDNSTATFDQNVRDSSGNNVYPGAQALTFYTTYSNPSSDVYTWNTRSDYSIDAFASGNLAFMYGYSYARDTIMQKSPNLNFDVAAVPQPQLNQTLVNYANYWGYGVSKQSKNSAVAWDFLKSMTAKDSLQKYYERHKLPSSRKDLISDQISDPEIGVFASQALTAKQFYKIDAVKVDAIISTMVDNIVLRGKGVQSALTDAVQQVNFLQRR